MGAPDNSWIGIFALERPNNFVENLADSLLLAAISALFLNLSSANLLNPESIEVP